MDRHAADEQALAMTCGECRQLTDWNPTSFCGWACYDARPRDPASAPLALSYFFGLGPPTLLEHPRDP
ncbi:hypothetical protein OG689_44100 [Kitasatospora sp. NBC_00240]|uniref:hypothetical protein n=1 Tax=Kitasatospora sp. NBC_00240 TaxID=2903567 RepID=UPI00224C7C9D|nr:hypothetical protein [Kitasatospora sp. NBC_00240]MCX5216120.1 hypothetical protein [Kitasatospora sp. NBC_00240]